ncbi:MAG: hypothetical protein KKA07_08540 [Bacteroidetes bacterium]|nr:hypothetical protein [Bacteroidota bacterium]MBU1719109.1 hypothetical protein [Bacteroidota bacterium]
MKGFRKLLFGLMLIVGFGIQGNAQTEVRSGTYIPLETTTHLNSKFVTTGQTIDLRVKIDVYVNDKIIFPTGSMAKGKIVRVQKAKGVGKGGFLEIQPESIIVDGQIVPLSGSSMMREGENRSGLAWGLSIGGCLFIGPLSFFSLFIKGKDVEFPKGTSLDAVVVKTFVVE